eukprot:1576187-Pyramimonas_sp.AAC.2
MSGTDNNCYYVDAEECYIDAEALIGGPYCFSLWVGFRGRYSNAVRSCRIPPRCARVRAGGVVGRGRFAFESGARVGSPYGPDTIPIYQAGRHDAPKGVVEEDGPAADWTSPASNSKRAPDAPTQSPQHRAEVGF